MLPMKRINRLSSRVVASIIVVLGSVSTSDAQLKLVTYDDVRPVLKKHCVSCHGPQRARGDLNLSTTEGIQGGSSSGVVAVSGKPEESLLYTLAAHLEAPKMPPGAPKIPERELEVIRKWIEDGMPLRAEMTVAEAASAKKMNSKPATVSMSASGVEAVKAVARKTAPTAVALHPKLPLIAVSGPQQIQLYSGAERLPAKAFAFSEGGVDSLRFSKDGEWLLAAGGLGGDSGKVVGFEVSSGRRLFEVGDESDAVLSFDLSPDCSLIALGGPWKTVKIYRSQSGELVAELGKHTDWILSVAFSPDGLLLATSDRFGGLQIWEAATGKPFYTLRGHVGAVNAVTWSKDSERLLSAGQDGTLRVWDMHQGTEVLKWDAKIGGVLAADWTSENQVVAGGRDRKIAVFDLTGQRIREWLLADEVVEMAVSADATRLVAGDASGNLSIWSIETGVQVSELDRLLSQSTAQQSSASLPRKQRSRTTAPVTKAVAVTTTNEGDAELAATLDALASAESAVKSAEESLAKLRESAAKLKQIAAKRQSALKRGADSNAVNK